MKIKKTRKLSQYKNLLTWHWHWNKHCSRTGNITLKCLNYTSFILLKDNKPYTWIVFSKSFHKSDTKIKFIKIENSSPYGVGVTTPVRLSGYWLQITNRSPVIGSSTGKHYSNQNTCAGERDLYGCTNHRKSLEDGTAGVQMERNRVKVGGAGWDTE